MRCHGKSQYERLVIKRLMELAKEIEQSEAIVLSYDECPEPTEFAADIKQSRYQGNKRGKSRREVY